MWVKFERFPSCRSKWVRAMGKRDKGDHELPLALDAPDIATILNNIRVWIERYDKENP